MGIIFHGRGYLSNTSCRRAISRRRVVKALTRQNIQFLKHLGFRVNPGGK